MPKLTQERLKELLHYDPETGIFAWLERILSRGKLSRRSGKIAGSINGDGYKQIRVDGRLHKASRLAFLYMEGYFPEHDVDHRNRIRTDDSWENLRHASRQCNLRNSNIRKDNSSGITGIYWHKARQKWHTRIKISGKCIHLGYFLSKINAARARWNAEIKHGFPGCNSTSSAYQYIQKHTK